jgi:hypothetical protein
MQLVRFPPAVMVLLAASATSAMLSALAISAMIGEVNRKLPEGQQVRYLLGYPGKLSEIKRKYRALYPNGHMARIVSALELLTAVGIAACALLIGMASRNL